MSNNRKNNIQKERIIMIASSVLVMVALTVTGVYMKNQTGTEQNDGYSIDFSELEGNIRENAGNSLNNGDGSLLPDKDSFYNSLDDIGNGMEDDLDYDPLAEVDSDRIEIPGLTQTGKTGSDSTEGDSGLSNPEEQDNEIEARNEDGDQLTEDTDLQGTEAEDGSQDQGEGISSDRQLSYSEEQGLLRPTMGDVLMHYSMDGSIYFKTLDQYKYNPAVMLAATEGDSVMACAKGQVISIYQDAEIGQAVILDLGDGYQATYGQLRNLTVSVGSYVNSGDILGYVASPTKYYSLEGTNLYFSLTKDSAPVNPEELFH